MTTATTQADGALGKMFAANELELGHALHRVELGEVRLSEAVRAMARSDEKQRLRGQLVDQQRDAAQLALELSHLCAEIMASLPAMTGESTGHWRTAHSQQMLHARWNARRKMALALAEQLFWQAARTSRSLHRTAKPKAAPWPRTC